MYNIDFVLYNILLWFFCVWFPGLYDFFGIVLMCFWWVCMIFWVCLIFWNLAFILRVNSLCLLLCFCVCDLVLMFKFEFVFLCVWFWVCALCSCDDVYIYDCVLVFSCLKWIRSEFMYFIVFNSFFLFFNFVKID